MTLIWHILRKDLRHTWVYASIGFGLLLVSALNFSRLLVAERMAQFSLISIQVPADALLLISWGLLSGVLMLAETIPGVRQHWLARPVRWQDLLCAKALLLFLLAVVPLMLVHLAQVASRGFSLMEYALAVSWNALLLVFIPTLGIAVLASISRNLQELVLWTLGIAGAGLASWLYIVSLRRTPEELLWVVNTISVWVAVAGGLAILMWQYATRRTWPGRIAVVGLFFLLVSMPGWPGSVWYAVKRTLSAQEVGEQVGALFLDSGMVRWTPNWLPGNYRGFNDSVRLVLRVDGVPENWTFEHNGWSNVDVRVSGSGDRVAVNLNEVRGSVKGNSFDIVFPVPSSFAERHRSDSFDIAMTGEFTVYGAPETNSLKVDGDRFIPGVGRCRSAARTELLVDCQTVLQPTARVLGYWGTAIIFGHREDRAPLARMPISFLAGGISANSNFDSKDIVFEVRKPLAYVQRRIEVRGVRWER